jgi:hypothetical protein
MRIRLVRAWNSLIALVAAAIVLQLWIAVRVSATPPGHAVGTLAETPMANRVLRVLSFFTIQSNILSGVTSAQLARNPTRDGRTWRGAPGRAVRHHGHRHGVFDGLGEGA